MRRTGSRPEDTYNAQRSHRKASVGPPKGRNSHERSTEANDHLRGLAQLPRIVRLGRKPGVHDASVRCALST